MSIKSKRKDVRMHMKGDRKPRIVSRILIIMYCMLVSYPIFFVIITSLKSTSEFYRNIWGLPETWEFGNYLIAWDTANIGEYMLNSVIVVSIVMAFTLIFGGLAGYALSRLKIRYAELIMFLIIVCTMLPSESVLMPMYLIISKMQITGKYLSLILPYIAWGLPMTTYIFRNFFNTLPNELLEAARIDGCTEVKSFTKIAVPMMLPAIATNAILLFVSWWGELLWASCVLAASNLKTIPLGLISFSAQFGTNWGPLCAAICIILIPLIIFFCFVQKYFVSGLTGGAVKG